MHRKSLAYINLFLIFYTCMYITIRKEKKLLLQFHHDINGFSFNPRVTIEHARSRRGRGGGPGMGGRFSPRFGGYRKSRSVGSRLASILRAIKRCLLRYSSNELISALLSGMDHPCARSTESLWRISPLASAGRWASWAVATERRSSLLL